MTTTLPTCLELSGLHVRYPDGAHAVRGVHLRVSAGETVAIVGESGCGKTTIAHAIVGLLPVKTCIEGSIMLGPSDRTSNGKAVTSPAVELVGLRDRRWRDVRGRRIGYVAQNPYSACDPLRSVRHHVASSWTSHGERPPQGAVEELLQSLGIPDAASTSLLRPHQWSGGMLQRASIAAAQALQPELIVADEPTSALDADLARSTLTALRGTDASVLLVTHDLALAAALADTIYVLYGGEVMEHGPAASLLGAPRHPYTQALLAALPRRRRVLPDPLPGSPPDPRKTRVACAFEPRCPLVHHSCKNAPALHDGVACHLEAP